MNKKKRSRDEEIAMMASISSRAKIPVGIIRNDDPNKWTLIANGSGNPETAQYGLPFLQITRKEGLRLKKQFGLRDDGGRFARMYHGDISGKGFLEAKKNAVKSETLGSKSKSKKVTKTVPVPEKSSEPVDFTIPKETHRQLQASKVNGFPFYAYTGAKPTIISKQDLSLKVPTNPNKVSKINIHYNGGSDLYDLRFLIGKKIDEIKGLYVDSLAETIVRKMGVN